MTPTIIAYVDIEGLTSEFGHATIGFGVQHQLIRVSILKRLSQINPNT